MLLDDALTKQRGSIPVSAINLLSAQRLRLAADLTDLLTYAQRYPAGYSYNDDERETVVDMKEEESVIDKSLIGAPLFDLDGTEILNQKLPLSLLKEAAMRGALPKHLRRDLVQATWIRAVLLDDTDAAGELAPTLKSLVPALKPFLDDYVAASQTDEKRFTAIYTWLKFPGMEPVVDAGVGRTTPLDQQDLFRDNWWCSAAVLPGASSTGEAQTPKTTASAFFSARATGLCRLMCWR